MQAIIPRYEFRAFAQNFGLAEEKMRKLSKLDKFRETSEMYILSNGNNENVNYLLAIKRILGMEPPGD